MISIDGAFGEGGGQVLRTSLALSLVTGTPFRIDRIRAGRPKPGLLRQHLTAVQAAMAVGKAQVEGATIGSQTLTFVPNQVTPGAYSFSVGTAGSTTLVLQTVLPALVLAPAPSTVTLEGGTHNPFAPPFDFLLHTFLPLLRRMGPGVAAVLDRPGFYPAGGGKCRVQVTPTPSLQRLDVVDRGEIRTRRAQAVVASLARSIAERELAVIGKKLGWPAECLQVVSIDNSRGPGNIVTITVESAHVTEVFTGFGARGVAAEAVATHAVQAAQQYLATDVAAGVYLADQLLIPMALAGSGTFTTLPLSPHTTTNMHVIAQFLPVHITAEPGSEQEGWRVTIRS